MLNSLKQELQQLGNPQQAQQLQRYFKTGKGEYAEGDVFLGIKVPVQRQIVKKYYKEISLKEIQELLDSKIHEYRFTGLMILVEKFKKSKRLSQVRSDSSKLGQIKDNITKRQIYEFYLKNTKNINNWDLVDLSAPEIVGEFIQKEGTEILKQLVKSEDIWERRIAILSTFPFIKKRNFGETLAISDMLINDEHDLIHKAVGWGLREVGKRNKKVLELFLSTRYKQMPRTMLRYAIEKFPQDERKRWMEK